MIQNEIFCVNSTKIVLAVVNHIGGLVPNCLKYSHIYSFAVETYTSEALKKAMYYFVHFIVYHQIQFNFHDFLMRFIFNKGLWNGVQDRLNPTFISNTSSPSF